MPFAGSDIMETAVIPMNEKGAILGQPGQYRNPPFLMLPGNPPLEEVTLYDFKINEIPEPEDIDNIPEDYGKELVEVMEKKVMAYTYYCDLDADADWDDSIFWDGENHTDEEIKACLDARNKGGDGSKENPWKNLTWALEQIACVLNNQCCSYIRILCSGTAHYSLRKPTIYAPKKFILEGADIDVSRTQCVGYYDLYQCYFNSCSVKLRDDGRTANSRLTGGFLGCTGGVFYNCHVEFETYYSHGDHCSAGFANCSGSHFYKCNAEIAAYTGRKYEHFVSGFYQCTSNSRTTSCFVDCHSKIKCLYDVYAFGFYECDSSCFYKCTSEMEEGINGYGFAGCDHSNFYSCNSVINSDALYANGFFDCEISKFYHCNARCTGKDNTDTRGFSGGKSSYFYNCKALANSTSGDVYGFYGANGSVFYDCDAVAETAKAPEDSSCSSYAYGFLNNAAYFRCTYSVSASASAIPDENGEFHEYEYECGIHDSHNCLAGYRCEKRTQEGTESC